MFILTAGVSSRLMKYRDFPIIHYGMPLLGC